MIFTAGTGMEKKERKNPSLFSSCRNNAHISGTYFMILTGDRCAVFHILIKGQTKG